MVGRLLPLRDNQERHGIRFTQQIVGIPNTNGPRRNQIQTI